MRELRRIWGKGEGKSQERERKGYLPVCRGWIFFEEVDYVPCCQWPSPISVVIVVNSQSHCMQEGIFNEKGAQKTKLFCSLSLSEIIIRITIYSL